MKLFTRVIPSLALAGALSIVAFTQARQDNLVTPEEKKEVLSGVTNIINRTAYVPGVDFTKWPEALTKAQSRIDKAKTPDQLADVVNELFSQFHASHIVFSTPQAARAQKENRFTGLGIRPELVKEGIQIGYVFSGSAAAKAGLEVGDIILEADGKPITRPDQLRGEEGSKVKIKLKRAKGSVETLTLTRLAFSTKIPETLTWVSPDFAVLSIPSFMTYSAKNVETLITQAAKAKTLVVDLRNNGGGRVTDLLHLCGLLLPEGAEIGTFINKKMADDYAEATGKPNTDAVAIAAWSKDKLKPWKAKVPRYQGQVICFVNGLSGSAAEMAAAAMRDVLGAPVIGQKSAGMVLASLMLPLPHGYQLQVPFQDYVTIKGVRLEGNGVPADMIAANPKALQPDPAVVVAQKWLSIRNASASK